MCRSARHLPKERQRGKGEARTVAEHLKRVFQVLEEALHLMAPMLSPNGLTLEQYIGETRIGAKSLLEAEDQREDHHNHRRPHQIHGHISRLPPLQGREGTAAGEEAGIEDG